MSSAFLGWVLDGALGAAVLAPLALALERLAPRRPALAHLAWTVVLVRLVLPPLPLLRPAPGPAPAILATDPAVLDHGPLDQAMVWMTRTFGSGWSRWLVLAALVPWLAVVALAGARELRRLVRLRRLLSEARPAHARVRRLVEELAARMGVAAPRVLTAEGVAAPFVCGALAGLGTGGGRRATLVVPRALSAHGRSAVLAHELAHLRRRDAALAWLELCAGALHAWNPIFHLARRRARTAAELAADELALRAVPGEALPYAEALLGLAGRAAPRRRAAPAWGGLGTRAGELELRLRRLVEARAARPPGAGRLPAAAWLCALPVALAPALLPPAMDLLPDYPTVTAADALLAELGVASWEELLASARARAEAAEDPRSGAEAQRHQGLALLALGRPAEAADAFARQLELGWGAPNAAYNLACARARAGQREEALDALETAFELGFSTPAALLTDPDLASLRGEPRLRALAERRAP